MSVGEDNDDAGVDGWKQGGGAKSRTVSPRGMGQIDDTDGVDDRDNDTKSSFQMWPSVSIQSRCCIVLYTHICPGDNRNNTDKSFWIYFVTVNDGFQSQIVDDLGAVSRSVQDFAFDSNKCVYVVLPRSCVCVIDETSIECRG